MGWGVGVVLGACWGGVEGVLEVCWGCVGGVLGVCWECVGRVLGACWEVVGGVLGWCWGCVGGVAPSCESGLKTRVSIDNCCRATCFHGENKRLFKIHVFSLVNTLLRGEQ